MLPTRWLGSGHMQTLEGLAPTWRPDLHLLEPRSSTVSRIGPSVMASYYVTTDLLQCD